MRVGRGYWGVRLWLKSVCNYLVQVNRSSSGVYLLLRGAESFTALLYLLYIKLSLWFCYLLYAGYRYPVYKRVFKVNMMSSWN